MALRNSVFQGSAPTQLSGFAPFPYTTEHVLKPPQMKNLTSSQATSTQGNINIGITYSWSSWLESLHHRKDDIHAFGIVNKVGHTIQSLFEERSESFIIFLCLEISGVRLLSVYSMDILG